MLLFFQQCKNYENQSNLTKLMPQVGSPVFFRHTIYTNWFWASIISCSSYVQVVTCQN